MSTIVINKRALSGNDLQHMSNIHVAEPLATRFPTTNVIVMNTSGEIVRKFCIKDIELVDMLDDVQEKHIMRLS